MALRPYIVPRALRGRYQLAGVETVGSPPEKITMDRPESEVAETNDLAGTANTFPQAESITLAIGLKRGKSPINKKFSCPVSFSAKRVKKLFEKERAKQVGKENVAASISALSGYYEGQAEASLSIQILNTTGQPFDEFVKDGKRLADRLGKQLCQDAVFLTAEDSKGETVTYEQQWYVKDDVSGDPEALPGRRLKRSSRKTSR